MKNDNAVAALTGLGIALLLMMLFCGCASTPPREWLVPAYIQVDDRVWTTQRLVTVDEAKHVAEVLVARQKEDERIKVESERLRVEADARVKQESERVLVEARKLAAQMVTSTSFAGSASSSTVMK